MRFGTSLGLVLLLCQCASPYETRDFPPFFKTDPPGHLSTAHVYERAQLEAKPELNVYERRRLQDLYELELRQLTRDRGGRIASLTQSIHKHAEASQALGEKVDELKREVSQQNSRRPADTSSVFVDPDFKKEYFAAYRLWNRDENDQALDRALDMSKNPRFEDLTRKERFKAYNLQFRIALDVQNLEIAGTAYAGMKDIDDCAQETADAGFLLALTYLGAGNPKKGAQVFTEQCDPDETAPNQVRRRYWSARFAEATGHSAPEEYEKIVDSGVPGYYYFLAHARLNKVMAFSDLNACSYRKGPIQVSSTVADWIKQAETNLKYRLRSDAATYLSAAVQAMRSTPKPSDVPAMLYLAHLFQAAGNQLEALKIYAVVTEVAQGMEAPFTFDFIDEMFPRPHTQWVHRVADEWKMDPDFLYAIMRQESAFNPGAISPMNARGLMQLMPFLAGQIAKQWRYEGYYSKKTLFFAKENLKFATFHLQQIQAQLPHPALVAAAYNAGSKRAANWWKRAPGLPLDVFVELIPIVETRNYVKLVLRNYVFYRLIRGDGKVDPRIVPMRLPDPTGQATSS